METKNIQISETTKAYMKALEAVISMESTIYDAYIFEYGAEGIVTDQYTPEGVRIDKYRETGMEALVDAVKEAVKKRLADSMERGLAESNCEEF